MGNVDVTYSKPHQVRTTLSLDPTDARRLRDLARADDVTVAKWIRRVVLRALKERGRK